MENNFLWPIGPERPHLPDGEIDIWRFHLSDLRSGIEELESILSADERERFAKQIIPDNRERLIASRAALRLLLSRYLGEAPENINFVYGKHGKPELATDCNNDNLRFNVSRRRDIGLAAFCVGNAVGIDIEIPDHIEDWENVAKRSLSKKELVVLRSLPAEIQRAAFFRAWAQKEAYTKGRGDGFQYRFQNFSVRFSPDQPAGLIEDEHDPAAIDRWRLLDISAEPGTVAALAHEGPDVTINKWGFEF